MINQKNSDYDKPQGVLGSEESVFNQPEKKGKWESKKKLKKVRSIRLHRLSSMRSSTRGGTECSEQPSPIEVADASPNYMKATTSSDAKDSFQSAQRLLTKKTFTRMSTLKLKRNLTRKLSGRTEPKRKLKSSRSIKLATAKGPKSTRKLSESIYGSDGQNRKSTSDAGSNKSQRVITRRLTLKPVRILTKMPTFKSKNSSMEKGPESGLHKATCSSTLKDSHFPDHIELPQEGSGSQGVSAMKVCPYTYCSLHGHRHGNLPPLKRFVSMRRRQLKTQKSMKMDGRSRQFGNARKATQRTKTVHSEDGISHVQNVKKLARDSPFKPHDSPASTVTGGGTSSGEDEEKHSFRCDAEVLLGETSFPHMINFEEYLGNSLAVKGYTSLAVKETNMECCCIATEKHKSGFEVTETAGNDKNVAACKKNDESATVESTEGKSMKPEVLQKTEKSFVQEEPKPASTTNVAYGMQERDQKYIKMWHLMYKHAVLSNTGKCENDLPFDGKDKEGREKDALTFNGVNSSSHNYCETDQDMDDEKENVIELVQKAFDEILLPEAEDLPSDDPSKPRGNGPGEVLLEKGEGKEEERNTSTFPESPKEAQRMETKPDQRTPKSWSNLKKLILLKRFVKALEKVRNINLRRPRRLPSDAGFEAEKVFLKHQTAEERKRAEEWMLDYALQKVVSKLAPAQRQRVTLLIEAFETILPFQDAENGLQSSATVEPQANPIQSLDASSGHSKEETNKGRDYGFSSSGNPMPELHNPIELKERCVDYPGTTTVKNMPAYSGAIEEDSNGKLSLTSGYNNGEKISIDNDNIYPVEIEDSRSRSLCKPVETISSCHEEGLANQMVNEVPEDLISNSNTENPNIKSESLGRYCETKNVVDDNREQFSVSRSLILNGLVRSLRSNLVDSEAPSNLLDEPTADRKEMIEKAKVETGTLEEFPTHQHSETPMSAVGEPETQLEKHSHTGLWYLVYKHMVSDMTENNSKSSIDGADEKESRDEGSRTRRTSVSYESTPVTNQDMHFKDHVVADEEVERRQNEAIKMVEEVIDSILPDVQDHLPHRQPFTDNTNSDNSSIQSDRTERMCCEGLNQKEERMESGNGIAQEQEEEKESASKEGNKPNQQLPRSWSNLKRVILLRRFIKALEKVRKFNPRGPRYLPIEPDPEAEKVNLRHQDMAERKGTEEWMLDYALRQVVSKLTPARKRKVELLVEAFETVTPNTKNIEIG